MNDIIENAIKELNNSNMTVAEFNITLRNIDNDYADDYSGRDYYDFN